MFLLTCMLSSVNATRVKCVVVLHVGDASADLLALAWFDRIS